jgi:hypothetical protein
MTTRIRTSIHTATTTTVGLALLGGLITIAPLVAKGQSHHDHPAPAALVQAVRDATRQFLDVRNAGPAGYAPALGCVSGPDHGAMGIHYVNGPLVMDGEIDVAHPEALIYEPSGSRRRFVGVEFIVDAKAWLSTHDAPPMLEGQAFQFVNSPNRYNLAPFFELHVWAWRDNPNGAFVDWNDDVSCEGQ